MVDVHARAIASIVDTFVRIGLACILKVSTTMVVGSRSAYNNDAMFGHIRTILGGIPFVLHGLVYAQTCTTATMTLTPDRQRIRHQHPQLPTQLIPHRPKRR